MPVVIFVSCVNILRRISERFLNTYMPSMAVSLPPRIEKCPHLSSGELTTAVELRLIKLLSAKITKWLKRILHQKAFGKPILPGASHQT